jgi:enoyl-[acyl-carrier protein] reductase I
MGLFDGKKGVIFGIANDRSIAWAITQELKAEGAQMGFTHLPDKDPERPKNRKKVEMLVESFPPAFLEPCDVTSDAHLDAVFDKIKATLGNIDFLLHSVAFAPPNELSGPVYNVSRGGFQAAMEISAYSLIAMAGRAQKIMNPGGSILTLTYLGGERAVPGYNLMGICKAALDSSMKYLASELGPQGVRVNALSAGPVRTISASGVGDFKQMLALYETLSPLRRNITEAEVGKAGMFLLSSLASGVTGDIMHVDSGYHCMGAPPLTAFKGEGD